MADLIREEIGDIVDVQAFDCENQVRSRMDQYINEALQSMVKVHEQLQETRRVNRYTILDEQGRPDITMLRRLYGSTDPRLPVDFDADQGNLVLFLARLIRSFDRVFSPLLNGHCLLDGNQKAAIFSRTFFELDFGRLRTAVEKLETGPFHFSSFPLSRHLQIKGERLGAVGNEMAASQLIIEGVGCLVDIGKTLVKLLGMRSPAQAAGGAEQSLEQVVLQGKTFALPYETRRLQAHPLLNGKTVFEALVTAVSVCFTAGLHFQDDFLLIFSGKEKKLQADLQERLKLMANLLDPENYRELSALYA